jgi:hypothetical protein
MPALDYSLQKRDVGSTLRTSLHFAFVPIGDIEIGLVTTQLGKRGGFGNKVVMMESLSASGRVPLERSQ